MPPDSPATTSGDAVAEPKPIVRVFVVANDVRAIDSAIQDVIDASRNLNAETSRQGVLPERGVSVGYFLTSSYGPRNRSPSKWTRWSGASAIQTSVSQEISEVKLCMARRDSKAVTKSKPAVLP